MTRPVIKPKDREAILNALRAGVVPRVGLQHIQVGRKREIEALLSSLDQIVAGGAALRFVIGEYGAGKTFFLFLIRQLALAKNLVVMQADLSPDRRLHATGGQARALFAALTANTATKSTPDGSGMRNILERFVGKAMDDAKKNGVAVSNEIEAKLADIRELAGGYDFASVVAKYATAYVDGAEEKMSAALRWLRGEYSTKTDAKNDLGVRTIVDDHNLYDSLKLFSRFVRHAGYAGLFICLDELVNLYKLQNAQARKQNFEQILAILNDVLQGSAQGIGFAFCGTPEFLYDTRRGLYSYEALQSRLSGNSFANEKLADYSGPVIQLQNLTSDELLVLLERLRLVFAGGDTAKQLVPNEALTAFVAHCQAKIGDTYFRTPRMTVKAFIDLLAVLEQNPGTDWRELIESTAIETDHGGSDDIIDSASIPSTPDDDLTRLRV